MGFIIPEDRFPHKTRRRPPPAVRSRTDFTVDSRGFHRKNLPIEVFRDRLSWNTRELAVWGNGRDAFNKICIGMTMKAEAKMSVAPRLVRASAQCGTTYPKDEHPNPLQQLPLIETIRRSTISRFLAVERLSAQ
jgi:hypothetical protein